MRPTCLVRVLGGFGVEIDGRPVPVSAWRHRRGAELVKLLALAPRHRLHRESARDELWPELEPEAASANLRKAVHFARRAMGGPDTIGIEDGMLVLWPVGELVVDAERAEFEAARALASGVGLEAAAALFSGELLPEDRYAEWAASHRERLRDRQVKVLRAARRWEQLLLLDRTDEEACRGLMREYLAAGNRQGAIRQFQRLRELLRADLGVGPEPATVTLFEEAVAMSGAEASSPVEATQMLLARGLVQWNRRELDPAQQLAESARDLALASGLGRELGEASALLGMVALARGEWPDRFRSEVADSLALGGEVAPRLLDSQLCLAEASLAGSGGRAIAALARELLPLAVSARSSPAEALMSLLIGESARFAGALDESREWLSRAVGLYQDRQADSAYAFALVHLASTAVALGERAEALRHLGVAHRIATGSELVSHLLIRVLEVTLEAEEGADRQRAILSEAEAMLRPREVCGPCSIGFRVAATIATARLGDLPQSRRWLGEAESLAGMWQGSSWQAAAWEARAEVRRAEGDRNQAAALFREAAGLFSECGRPLDAARCTAAGSR